MAYEFQYELKDDGAGKRPIGMALVSGLGMQNMVLSLIDHLDDWNGFWMLFQFESDGVLNDPNGKYLRTASAGACGSALYPHRSSRGPGLS